MDAVTAACFTRFTQIHCDLAVAIDAAAGQRGMLDQTEQPLILTFAGIDCLPLPAVITAAMHAKDSAHRVQEELAEMGSHERIPWRYPFAKYAAA
ncbi:hypothetical protein WT27_06915 [Burkholderia territorii]|uniref:Uncharacterized protein n=1 Tax=Burkholderia territorii TaxID=1503055 RepID=A0A119DN76_9BURK|nr:hypothetical protein WT27_06915 [Burkholderia territorii]KVX38722.1 hypothetical protein WT31_03155 [Burkholderia territorii]